MNKKEMIKEIKDSGLYDFVTNNFHNMNKEDLKDIITECIIVATSDDFEEKAHYMGYSDRNECFDNMVAESLEEERDWNEEE